MTESLEPIHEPKKHVEISDRKVKILHSMFNIIMREAFPNGIGAVDDGDNKTYSAPSATKGSDLAIAQASSLELRELVEENFKKQAQYRTKLETSQLTGMPNREAFIHWLEQEIASGKSEKLTIGFLDMDRLKAINDTFGHELADDVIRRIGLILSSGVRTDEDMIAAHRSGDEFLIGISGADKERILEFANSSLGAINRLYIRKNPEGNSEIIEINPNDTTIDKINLHHVGASMGFASKLEGMDVTQLMTAADKAMYEAKKNGRNQIVFS